MSGRPHIKITESVENLREIFKQLAKNPSFNRTYADTLYVVCTQLGSYPA
jgi:hypothetical protein